jgi:hypothetical protein
MRIRTIKPEFYRSDDITALSREHRLLFIGLWSYVDDNGVGVDDFRQIAADLFALEDDQKEVRDFVREGLATLSRALLVSRYEVGGKRFIFITGWDKHQRIDRPGKPRYPRPVPGGQPPTCEDEPESPSVATSSRDLRDGVAAGTGEQGNRGTTKDLPRASPAEPDGFAEFWDAYPKKADKRAAEKAYRAAVKRKAAPAHLLASAKRYAAVTRTTEPRFIKNPATWLNAGAYDDAPAEQLPQASGQHQPWRNYPDQSVYDEPMFPTEEPR